MATAVLAAGMVATGYADKRSGPRTVQFSPAAGDINDDGFVDVRDLRIVVADLGLAPFEEPRSDVNGDGAVDVFDLALVARELGELTPRPLRGMSVERAFSRPELSAHDQPGPARRWP